MLRFTSEWENSDRWKRPEAWKLSGRLLAAFARREAIFDDLLVGLD